MTRTQTLKTFGLVMIALLVTSVASAAGPARGDFKRTYPMETTDEGTQFRTLGYVALERANGVEMFGIRVFAKLPDGANLIVEVQNEKGKWEVGTFEMFLGSGSLILYSSNEPSPAFPLPSLSAVEVRDSRGRLLAQLGFPDASIF